MSQKRPAVSIITPAYNAEKYIEKTIESIQAQTFKDYEHIIIDDCSSDRTSAIIKRYARGDPKIRLIKHSSNTGASVARNDGIEIAQGEYITFVDGDDFLVDDMLEVLHDNATTYDTDLICFNKFIYKDESQEVLEETWIYKVDDLPNVFNPRKDISVFSFIFAPLNICAFLKRDFIIDNQLRFDGKYRRNEDVLFMTKAMALADKASYIKRELYYYRVGMTSNMTATLDGYKDDGWMVVRDLHDFLVEKQLFKGNIKTSFNILCCSVLWHYIHNMRTYEGQKYALGKTKDLAKKIGLDKIKNPGDIYSDINFYEDFQRILSENYEQYLWNKLQRNIEYEKDLVRKINSLDIEITHRDLELNNLTNSFTWRVTSPFRKVKNKMLNKK